MCSCKSGRSAVHSDSTGSPGELGGVDAIHDPGADAVGDAAGAAPRPADEIRILPARLNLQCSGPVLGLWVWRRRCA